MANGDTKTEAMLNVLGNGGTGDEFRGCCNTKTQSYILDAIDRINSLAPGGSSDFNDLENRPQLNGVAMTGSTDITDFVGTDGTSAGEQGLVPAPTAADADKFLKSDGTWDTAGGGGGDTVYSTTQTSSSATGGAVYIGNKDASQVVQTDPTAAGTYKYFYALPANNTSQGRNGQVCILGTTTRANTIAIGNNAQASWDDAVAISGGASAYSNGAIGIGAYTQANQNSVAIGKMSMAVGQYGVCVGYTNGSGNGAEANYSTALGANTRVSSANTYSVALGSYAQPTRAGEVNVGLVTGATTSGYNGTAYRVIGGVHDGVDAHDAVTVGQLNALITAINSALGTSIPSL